MAARRMNAMMHNMEGITGDDCGGEDAAGKFLSEGVRGHDKKKGRHDIRPFPLNQAFLKPFIAM
jgi:hypothetical protein